LVSLEMSRKTALAAFFAGRAARIILAGSDPVDAPDNTAAQVSDIILSNLVVREDASNGLVGYLYATGTTAAVTFSITVDADGIFAIQNGNELHKVDSFGTGADYAITIKATETVGGAEYSEAFTIDVIPAEDDEDDSGIGDGGGSGDVEIPDDEDPDADTDPYVEPPVEVVTEVAAKVSGKTGGTSVFLKDWGVPVAGRVYVMKYSADWTGMSAQGRYAAVGFGFKHGNNFHMAALRGNGAVSTTMLGSRLYGDFRKSKQFTITNDGAATHGTKNGPNWLRLTVSGDASTYTLESSADGVTWASEIADVAAAPLASVTTASQFGPAAYFYEEDKGPFVISITEFWQKPVNTVAPAITGTAQQGQTLTASTGTWTGSGIVYTYQWKRAGVNIASATASTYVLVLADVGSTITVAVTATNDGGATTTTSAATATVVPLAPVNTVLPAITGTTTEGQTLTVSNGTWSNTPTGYTYQWKRGGVNISAATNSTYALQAADVGTTITCTVTATNAGGSTAATSAATATIAANVTIPVNTVAPAITGTVTVGSLLTCSSGTWSGGGSITYAYQWKIDGVSIVGATSSTYTILQVDEAGQFTCEVTATNAAGSGTPQISNTTSAVPDPNFSSVVLLHGYEGSDGATSTTDESPTTPHTFTFNGNAQIDTAQKKFGASSLLLDGTGDFLTRANNTDFDFSNTTATSFTIEMFARFNATGINQVLMSVYSNTGGIAGWYFQLTSTGNLSWNYYDGGNFRTAASSGVTFSTGVWYHLAVSRVYSGGTCNDRIYRDGVYLGKVTYTLSGASAAASEIGRLGGSADRYFNGWIDELRVTKGVARYTTESSFSPPVRAFARA
jgi:hypothetical protein